MIYLYYGKIGDGKTYHVVRNELIPAILAGRRVYTNIEGLNFRYISTYLNISHSDIKVTHIENPEWYVQNMTLQSGQKEWTNPHLDAGSLIIIDEAQRIWDARDFRNTKKEFLSFLEYHRHFGFDIVFITQNPKRLESSILRLSNESYQVKNLKFLGSFLGRRYVLHARQTPLDRDIIYTTRGVLRDDIFLCYQSYQSRPDVQKKSKGALSQLWVYAICILILVPVIMFVAKGGLSFTNKKNVDKIVKGVSNGGNNNNKVSTDFRYDSPNQASLAVPQAQNSSGLSSVSSSSDCETYSGVRGDTWFRRGDTLLYQDKKTGIWYDRQLNCEKQEIRGEHAPLGQPAPSG